MKTAITCIAAAVILTTRVVDASEPVAKKEQLDNLVPQLLETHSVPAAGIAVSNSAGLVLAATYGEARPGLAATEDTLFNVASVTKMLTAETVLRLAGAGAFDIDSPMAPTWADPDIMDDPRHTQLTVRHALAHQTGFPNWRSMTDDQRLVIQFEPGSRPGYSGEGFQYVARFSEAVTETTFPDLVADTVLKPAKVSAALFGRKPPLPETWAWSKNKDGDFKPAVTWDSWSAADDLYTTPAAFAKILSTMISGDSLPPELERDRRTIQFDMTQQFCGREAFAAICPNAIGFGLSGVIFEYENETVIWQGGGDVGERAIAFYVPERNLAVTIFTNGANGAKLFAPIAALFYDNPDYLAFLKIQGEQG